MADFKPCGKPRHGLLRLLSLLQTRRDWSGAELPTDWRSLRAPYAAISTGCAASATQCWPLRAPPATGWVPRDLPPLLLDDDEAVAVAMGLRTAAGGSITGIEETSVRALAKLEQVLPSRLRHRINALQSVTVPMVNTGPTVDPSTLTAIAAACRDSLRLRFDYCTHDGTSSIRTTEPHRLVHRPALVPRRLGRRPPGLAHLPRGPPRSAYAHRPSVHPAHPARPRYQRLHLAGDLHVCLPLPGSVHPARQRRDCSGADRPHHRCAGADRRAQLHPAGRVQLAGRVGHLRDNQRVRLSRCTNPRSLSSTSGRWQPGLPARRTSTAIGSGQQELGWSGPASHVTAGRAVSSQVSETESGISGVMIMRVFVAGVTGVIGRRLVLSSWPGATR